MFSFFRIIVGSFHLPQTPFGRSTPRDGKFFPSDFSDWIWDPPTTLLGENDVQLQHHPNDMGRGDVFLGYPTVLVTSDTSKVRYIGMDPE